MTIQELYGILKSKGVQDEDIYLHGRYGDTNDNMKVAMTIKMGKYTAIWEVYYKEKGEKSSSIEFDNESEACDYYLKRFSDV